MARVALKWTLTCCLAAALGAAAGCRTNPVSGDLQFMVVGPELEISLGHQNHPSVVFMYDGEYYEPGLNRYLGTIVTRLHACSHRPDFPMEFTMVNTSVINAFATPGHVYATRGFLARLEDEAQFASVMGHELAHVTAGHSAKQMSNSLLTGLVFGVVNAAAGDTLTGQAVVGLGQVSVVLLGLSYSREQERQADRVGTYYMALAGWDTRQAIAMQRLLASLNEREPTFMDKYLSTHPLADDRIAEIEAVIVEKDLASGRHLQGDGIYAERWRRRLTQLRAMGKVFEAYDRGAKALAEEKYDEALSAANEAIAARADQAPFHRLRGDALLALERTEEARTAYAESLGRDPRYVPATLGLGRAYLAEEDFTAAETQFAVAAHGFPGSVLAWYGLGYARYRLEKYAEAVGPLEKAAGALEKGPDCHYMLALCYDQTGQPTKAYLSYRRALAAGLSGDARQKAEERTRVLKEYAPPPSS